MRFFYKNRDGGSLWGKGENSDEEKRHNFYSACNSRYIWSSILKIYSLFLLLQLWSTSTRANPRHSSHSPPPHLATLLPWCCLHKSGAFLTRAFARASPSVWNDQVPSRHLLTNSTSFRSLLLLR